jgi:hypothetical protein
MSSVQDEAVICPNTRKAQVADSCPNDEGCSAAIWRSRSLLPCMLYMRILRPVLCNILLCHSMAYRRQCQTKSRSFAYMVQPNSPCQEAIVIARTKVIKPRQGMERVSLASQALPTCCSGRAGAREISHEDTLGSSHSSITS